jgi:hypothetical protein
LKIAPESYALDIRMSFSPDVSLGQVVAGLRNGALLHEFNPDADPIRTVGANGDRYDTIMAWKAFGIRTAQLSHCRETEGDGTWSRRCDVDTGTLDAGKYTAWKWDEVTCRSGAGKPLACAFRIEGKIKNFLFMKSSVLTLKAKRQALINWGRFWYLMESAGASTRLSNPIFERSELKRDVEALLSANLDEAKACPGDFKLQRHGAFSGPVIR